MLVFGKIVPWIPTFSDTQFVAMSYLYLIQATFLFIQCKYLIVKGDSMAAHAKTTPILKFKILIIQSTE
jgi:hypothetical protein